MDVAPLYCSLNHSDILKFLSKTEKEMPLFYGFIASYNSSGTCTLGVFQAHARASKERQGALMSNTLWCCALACTRSSLLSNSF